MFDRPAGEPLLATHLKAMMPTSMSVSTGDVYKVEAWKLSVIAMSGTCDSVPVGTPLTVLFVPSTIAVLGRKFTGIP